MYNYNNYNNVHVHVYSSVQSVLLQVHLFEFPSGVDAVTVQAEASSQRCAILSIQNVTVNLHVNDIDTDIIIICYCSLSLVSYQ